MFSPKFIYKPYSHFVVRELVELSKEDFTKLFLNLEERFVSWSNGLLLHFTEFDGSEKDKTKYFNLVHFSECTELPKLLEYNGFKLDVIDVSNADFYDDFAIWLKRTLLDNIDEVSEE